MGGNRHGCWFLGDQPGVGKLLERGIKHVTVTKCTEALSVERTHLDGDRSCWVILLRTGWGGPQQNKAMSGGHWVLWVMDDVHRGYFSNADWEHHFPWVSPVLPARSITIEIAVEYKTWEGFPGGSVVKNLPANAEDAETWVQSLGRENPLEEEMATHVSILAWRIPWTEEPGRLQSMGSQRVGHALVTMHARTCQT